MELKVYMYLVMSTCTEANIDREINSFTLPHITLLDEQLRDWAMPVLERAPLPEAWLE